MADEPEKLTPKQRKFLDYLATVGPAFDLEKGEARTVADLEDRGMVKRKAYAWHITAAGKAALKGEAA